MSTYDEAWRPCVIDGFLSLDECVRIRAAMDAAPSEPAEVLGDSIAVKRRVRRVAQVEVSAATVAWVEARIEASAGRIEEFYGITLGDREGAGFLRYGPGSFYAPHRDRGVLPSWPDAARRQVAVVVFLADAAGAMAPGTFSGGRLCLYPEDAAGGRLEIVPRAGALVAFPAAMLHEVTEVTEGIRDAVVDWFYEHPAGR